MARRKSEAEELDELVSELDELDEDVFEDDEFEDATDEDRPKRKGKKGKKAAAKKGKAKKERTGIGTAELAEEAGVESRVLRQLLRKEFPMEEGQTRYEWKSLDDPQARRILKRIASGAAKDTQRERLAELKERKAKKGKKATAKKGAAKKTATKKSKKRRTRDDD